MKINFWRLLPTFDIGWGCGHTDTYVINVKKKIREKYTIEAYYKRTHTYIVSEVCPYCEARIRGDADISIDTKSAMC